MQNGWDRAATSREPIRKGFGRWPISRRTDVGRRTFEKGKEENQMVWITQWPKDPFERAILCAARVGVAWDMEYLGINPARRTGF